MFLTRELIQIQEFIRIIQFVPFYSCGPQRPLFGPSVPCKLRKRNNKPWNCIWCLLSGKKLCSAIWSLLFAVQIKSQLHNIKVEVTTFIMTSFSFWFSYCITFLFYYFLVASSFGQLQPPSNHHQLIFQLFVLLEFLPRKSSKQYQPRYVNIIQIPICNLQPFWPYIAYFRKLKSYFLLNDFPFLYLLTSLLDTTYVPNLILQDCYFLVLCTIKLDSLKKLHALFHSCLFLEKWQKSLIWRHSRSFSTLIPVHWTLAAFGAEFTISLLYF